MRYLSVRCTLARCSSGECLVPVMPWLRYLWTHIVKSGNITCTICGLLIPQGHQGWGPSNLMLSATTPVRLHDIMNSMLTDKTDIQCGPVPLHQEGMATPGNTSFISDSHSNCPVATTNDLNHCYTRKSKQAKTDLVTTQTTTHTRQPQQARPLFIFYNPTAATQKQTRAAVSTTEVPHHSHQSTQLPSFLSNTSYQCPVGHPQKTRQGR